MDVLNIRPIQFIIHTYSAAYYIYIKYQNNYPGPPGDGNKKWLVGLDNAMVSLYTNIKGRLGANDKIVSSILKMFSGRKKQ